MNKFQNYSSKGFTIVELLIVIVVIGILASITIVSYSGIQERARQVKIASDQGQILQAVQLARSQNGNKLLHSTTSSFGTAGSCMGRGGVDLAKLDRSDPCWVDYLRAMQRISDDSGVNITNIVDPWGRPYVIDENEGENPNSARPCGQGKDYIGTYKRPLTSNWDFDNYYPLPFANTYTTGSCSTL